MVALPGVDPSWSAYRAVPSSAAVDPAGTVNRWHYLDNSTQLRNPPRGTLLCVHGNPTWSYLWRSLLAAGANHGWRVIAVDQLNMGFSERTGRFRRLADRVDDLGDFAAALGLSGPVITVGHDWGGVVSLGYAHRNRQDLAGVVLTNTAIHQDPDRPIPAALRLALHPLVHRWGTRDTTAFLDITHSLARPALAPEVRAAFREPYRRGSRRQGIADFVADIPADPSHPSYPALRDIAEGIRTLQVPALILWGPGDPIFSDTYLDDLAQRLPQAAIHRFEGASHLVGEDRDIATPLFRWLAGVQDASGTLPAGPDDGVPAATAGAAGSGGPARTAGAASGPSPSGPDSENHSGTVPPFAALEHELVQRARGDSAQLVAVADMGTDGAVARSLSWQELERDVDHLADALGVIGVRRGSRISLMVPPGVDLTVLLYACLRIGAVIVVADAGLGPKGLSRAVRGTVPDFLVGIDRALVAARLFGWPGRRISVGQLPWAKRRFLGVEHSLDDLRADGRGSLPNTKPSISTSETGNTDASNPGARPADADPGSLDPDADAAILFTSGSTGPAKGVVYTHRRLAAMRDTMASTFGIRPGDGLVAGFAPFALLGPALGTTSITPDMDVTKPRTLTATALADAAAAINATAVFASPAALRNILATADTLTTSGRDALAQVSLLLSAGAPVPEPLLASLQRILPAASLHTPYGMTEALPVTDVDLEAIRAAEADASSSSVEGAGNGVCVGRAVSGAHLAVSALNAAGTADGEPVTGAGVTGEILVRAPHVKERYHRLWQTQQDSARTGGWHRTGDVGHFDAEGRLWVEGRLGHIITAPDGVRTPVGPEQALERLDDVGLAAIVGVGPAGTQVTVAVVEPVPPAPKPGLADADLAARAREAARGAGVELAAVLVVRSLPTDIRHNAKIDRTRVAAWASRVLAGGRMGQP